MFLFCRHFQVPDRLVDVLGDVLSGGVGESRVVLSFRIPQLGAFLEVANAARFALLNPFAKQERDILKKAISIFSKGDGKSSSSL